MKRILIALPLVALLCGGTSQHGIVNGQAEDGAEPVVALGAHLGEYVFSACTGTLIAPRVVLTAAHCGADLPLEAVVELGQAFFGPSINAPTHEIGFTDLVVHPDYVELVSEPGQPTQYGDNDVSVLILAEAVTDVEPALLRRNELTDDDLETELLSVGFGTTSGDGEGGGEKRSAILTVDQLWQHFILSDSVTNPNSANICGGDSGGPMLLVEEGRLVEWAVHSWGDANCTTRSGSSRTDLLYEWILDQVEAVHDSRDLCEINGFYEDGWCDAECLEIDPDCVEPKPEDDADSAGDDDDDGGGAACSGCERGDGSMALLPLLVLPVLLRRRREA
jgi:hypothetical protein